MAEPEKPHNAPAWNTRRIIIVVLLIPIVVLFFYNWIASTADRERGRQAGQTPAPPMAINRAQNQPTTVNRPISDFSLVNQKGETVTAESLKGRPWAAFFFYTTCPGPCIVLNNSIEDAQVVLEDFPRLRFIGITVDPEYDTPERLQEYSKHYDFSTDHWMYLTGPEEEVYEVVRNDFLLPVVETPEQMRESEGPITHSGKVGLVNKNGFLVEYVDGLAEDFPERLREALLRNGM